MKKVLWLFLEFFILLALLKIYTPLCATIFSIFSLSENAKLYIIPFIEELLRLISVICGGIVQYLYTLVFATSEFMHYLTYVELKYGSIPNEYYIYRFICILVHISLLFLQIRCYLEYKRTKRIFFIIFGYGSAVIFHQLYNYQIGKWIMKLLT